MSKEKQIESTDWLTRGISKEQLEQEKQIDGLTADIANMPNSVDCIVAEAEYLYSKGWRKQSENTVELPCKVGDILYVISQMKDRRILPFINEYEVTSISIKRKSIVVYHEMDGYIKSFKQTDFGRTIFLTKEEAKKALAKMKGGAE